MDDGDDSSLIDIASMEYTQIFDYIGIFLRLDTVDLQKLNPAQSSHYDGSFTHSTSPLHFQSTPYSATHCNMSSKIPEHVFFPTDECIVALK